MQSSAMTFLLFLTFLTLSLFCIGCSRNSSAPPTASTTPQAETSAVAAEAGLANVLTELTQALRKFSVEQRRVPASLNELVAAGYIKNPPQPPPGKTFRIDAKNVQVILK